MDVVREVQKQDNQLSHDYLVTTDFDNTYIYFVGPPVFEVENHQNKPNVKKKIFRDLL